MGRRVVGVVVGIAVALLGVAACSSGHRSATPAGTVRVRITTTDPAHKGKVLDLETGTLDFARGIGEYHLTLNVGQKADEQRLTMIVHGTVELVQLTAEAKKPLPALVVAGKHWMTQPHIVSRTDPLGTNPYTELTKLRAQGVKVADRGTARVDGRTVRHYHATVTKPEPSIPDHHLMHVTYDLYVDGSGRVVRLVSSTTHDVDEHALEDRNQVDYSDFGAPVHITLPRASDIVQYSTSVAPTPKLAGAWAQVASGRNAHLSWKLFRAPADLDRVCWSFETTPPLRASSLSSSGVVGFSTPLPTAAQMRAALGSTGPWPRHDGHDATCTRTGPWQTDVEAIASTSSVVVAVVQPDVVAVTAKFGLGLIAHAQGIVLPTRSRRLAIDPRFHGFVDLAPPPSLITSPPGGIGDYVLTKRDGSHVTCGTTYLAIDELGASLDPCASPFGSPTGRTSAAAVINPAPPSF